MADSGPDTSALGPHPLLAQIPLTVSPFVSLPTATTLPYTYKKLPSTLPPPSTGDPHAPKKHGIVVSASGHAANPDEIVDSCRRLQAHLRRQQDEADGAAREWNEQIKQRELAEKRSVAPGWLDREEKLLEPQRLSEPPSSAQSSESSRRDAAPPAAEDAEGTELDRAFGGLGVG